MHDVTIKPDFVEIHVDTGAQLATLYRVSRSGFDEATFARFTALLDQVRPRFTPRQALPGARASSVRTLAVWLVAIVTLVAFYNGLDLHTHHWPR